MNRKQECANGGLISNILLDDHTVCAASRVPERYLIDPAALGFPDGMVDVAEKIQEAVSR